MLTAATTMAVTERGDLMTDQPHEPNADDVEGHGRLGQFLDTDATIDDPYPVLPSGASER